MMATTDRQKEGHCVYWGNRRGLTRTSNNTAGGVLGIGCKGCVELGIGSSVENSLHGRSVEVVCTGRMVLTYPPPRSQEKGQHGQGGLRFVTYCVRIALRNGDRVSLGTRGIHKGDVLSLQPGPGEAW